MNKNSIVKGTFFIFFLTTSIFAQEVSVKNVTFNLQNNAIHLIYDLIGSSNSKYNISIQLLRKSDSTFSFVPEQVSGDIGDGIRPGIKRKIVWDIQNELKVKLKGNDYFFKINAEYVEESSSWYYYLGGALATGAITWVIIPPKEEKKIADPPGRP